MLDIRIKSIPPNEMRYPTLGDYWIDENGVMQFRVVELRNKWKELAIATHELVEAFLCLLRGIKWEDIDKFDMGFGGETEPGDSAGSPYRKEHRFAENIERQLIHEFGFDWVEYDEETEGIV